MGWRANISLDAWELKLVSSTLTKSLFALPVIGVDGLEGWKDGWVMTCLLDDIDVISSIGLVEDAIVKLEVEGTSGFVKLGPLTAEAEIGFVLADIPVLVVVGVVGMIEMLLGW